MGGVVVRPIQLDAGSDDVSDNRHRPDTIVMGDPVVTVFADVYLSFRPSIYSAASLDDAFIPFRHNFAVGLRDFCRCLDSAAVASDRFFYRKHGLPREIGAVPAYGVSLDGVLSVDFHRGHVGGAVQCVAGTAVVRPAARISSHGSSGVPVAEQCEFGQ